MVEIFDDIRKLYIFSAACEALNPFIEFFSESSLEVTRRLIRGENFTVKLFPSYTPTIWINLGSSYQLMNGGNLYQIGAGQDILVLRNQILERRNQPSDNIFTVKFNPGGFEAIFGIEQEKIGSEIVDLEAVLPATIIRKLRVLDGFNARRNLLEDHFLHLMNMNFEDNFSYRKVVEACNVYSQSQMVINNRQLAKDMAMTEKTFYRHFKKLIGTSPKEYLSILRARSALTAYVKDREKFSPFDFGYYDNSHFSKEVVRFTGKALSAYRS